MHCLKCAMTFGEPRRPRYYCFLMALSHEACRWLMQLSNSVHLEYRCLRSQSGTRNHLVTLRFQTCSWTMSHLRTMLSACKFVLKPLVWKASQQNLCCDEKEVPHRSRNNQLFYLQMKRYYRCNY